MNDPNVPYLLRRARDSFRVLDRVMSDGQREDPGTRQAGPEGVDHGRPGIYRRGGGPLATVAPVLGRGVRGAVVS